MGVVNSNLVSRNYRTEQSCYWSNVSTGIASFSFQAGSPYQVENKRKWVCQNLVCQRREFAARSSSKFQDVKFQDLKFKHEIFMKIDMKNLYTSQFFLL